MVPLSLLLLVHAAAGRNASAGTLAIVMSGNAGGVSRASLDALLREAKEVDLRQMVLVVPQGAMDCGGGEAHCFDRARYEASHPGLVTLLVDPPGMPTERIARLSWLRGYVREWARPRYAHLVSAVLLADLDVHLVPRGATTVAFGHLPRLVEAVSPVDGHHPELELACANGRSGHLWTETM